MSRSSPRRLWASSALVLAGLLGHALAADAQPSPLWGHSAIYDPPGQRMVVFGGIPLTNDTWECVLSRNPQWRPLSPGGSGPPTPRFAHSAIHDAARNRMLVFGGQIAGAVEVADVWVLSLGTPPTWEELQPDSTPPTARSYHTAIFDSARDRMVVFGGKNTLGGTTFRDAWSLWLSPSPRWERIEPDGTAPPFGRYGHSAIYDRDRDRMLVYGAGTAPDDVWALTFANTTWSRVTTSNPPPRRSYHTAIYDHDRDVMVVFGGNDGNLPLNDVWELDLATRSWRQRTAATLVPSPRQNHSAVHDTLFDRTVTFGGANATDPTWALTLEPEMRWSPDRPFLECPADLDIPQLTVGDVRPIHFSVANQGLRSLNVSELRAPQTMQLSDPGPLALSWHESVPETLTFAPDSAGTFQDSLVLVSNDPITPRRQVALTFRVLGLDFSARVLDEPAEVPLGTSFVVVATPDSGVRVETAMLFYRIAGSGSSFDSLAFTALATDFIASIPASAVTENGVEYYVRVTNRGFRSTRPLGAPASFYTQAVAHPSVLSALPRPTSGSDFLSGREVDVDVILPVGSVFVSGTLHYRIGGSSDAESAELTLAAGRPVATIPAEAVGPRGLEYWVEVTTATTSLRYPAVAPGVAFLRARVPNLTEPVAHAGGRYRLLSVPLEFGSDFSGNLHDLLTDQLGTYDPVRWRAFRFDAASQVNVELPTPPAAAFRPDSARAFWLITRDAHQVDTRPASGLSTPTDGPFALRLEPGWNLVGNPFDFPVAWSDVIRDQGAVGDAVAFDPLLGTLGDYADATPSRLEPFAGYFVHATARETLWVPPREATALVSGGNSPGLTPSPEFGVQGWRLRITARTEQAVDGSNAFGVEPGARDDFDALDAIEPPPPPGPWARIAFTLGGEPVGLRRDLRSLAGEGHVWDIEVSSATPGELITLEISGAVVPDGHMIRLVDERGGWVDGNISDSRSVVLQHRLVSPGRLPHRFSIVVGDPEFVERRTMSSSVIPARLTLEPATPNPFRWATEIRFGLPRASLVDLDIFDVQGQRVASPLRRVPLDPGVHSVLWDGKRRDGSPAPSGFYVLRLNAAGETRTIRALLVR